MNAKSAIQRFFHTPIIPRRSRRARVTITQVVGPLPPPLQDLVRTITRRTRLWKSERLDVARELASHFQEGLDYLESEDITAQPAVDRLITEFGPPRQAAKLIRRAKRRCRPLWWKFRHRTQQAVGLLILLFACYVGWRMNGSPNVKTDYVAQWNAPIKATAPEDRAWPLYEKAIAAYHEPPVEIADVNTQPRFPGAPRLVSPSLAKLRSVPPNHPAILGWLEHNQAALDHFAAAAKRPVYAREYGSTELEDQTPDDQRSTGGPKQEPLPLMEVLLPELGRLRRLAIAATTRARLRAARKDFEGACEDLIAVEGTANLLFPRHSIVEHLTGIGLIAMAERAARRILRDIGPAVERPLLRTWAHAWAGAVPSSAPWGDPSVEKDFLLDAIQRVFTESRTGNGHVIPSRAKPLLSLVGGQSSRGAEAQALSLAMAMCHADRKETLAMVQRCYQMMTEDLRRPLYDPQRGTFERFIKGLSGHKYFGGTPLVGEYGLVATFVPVLTRYDERMRQAQADHHATLVCLAVLAYHAKTARYPATLDALVPEYLPSLPIDPYDGKPLKYRPTDGGADFVLYSIAADFSDDGGAGKHAWEPRASLPDPVDYIFWPPQP